MCNLTQDFDSIYFRFWSVSWFTFFLSVSYCVLVTGVSEFCIMCHSSPMESHVPISL